jgi:RNA polymerase sigma-70 factor (ECF subfamily)
LIAPDGALLTAIHHRLVDRDPVAPTDLAEMVLDPLCARVRRRFPSITDATMIHDAVVDAVLTYAEQPERFDPSKRGLLGYLMMSAEGDLKNALRARSRVEARRSDLEVVELAPSRGNKRSMSYRLSDRIEEQVVDAMTTTVILKKVATVADNPSDAAALQMLIDGERSTDRFAEVFGLSHLDPAERKRAVKRHKDRLKKRLERLGGEPNE